MLKDISLNSGYAIRLKLRKSNGDIIYSYFDGFAYLYNQIPEYMRKEYGALFYLAKNKVETKALHSVVPIPLDVPILCILIEPDTKYCTCYSKHDKASKIAKFLVKNRKRLDTFWEPKCEIVSVKVVKVNHSKPERINS